MSDLAIFGTELPGSMQAPRGIDKLAPAWVAALGELRDVKKDKKADAGSYGYKYADLGAALEQVRPVLSKHGLAIFQTATREGPNVAVQTVVMHESGQVLIFEPLTMPGGSNPQGAGSGITYARRYALMAVCGLATEDDDGAKAVEVAHEERRAPKREPEIPKGFVGSLNAKKRIAAACGGDKELATRIWSESGFGSEPVDVMELEAAEDKARDAARS